MIWKSCPRCGKLHPKGTVCRVGQRYGDGQERQIRRSNRWTEKSREIRERSNWICEVCKQEKRYTTEGVQVHHIERIKNNPSLAYDDSNLIALCKKHHDMAENGEISAEYLRELVRQREGH